MNTQPAFARDDPEPETPDLADVMGMLARLSTVPAQGRDGRRLTLALSAVNVEALDGLVIQGETYAITYRTEYAVCRCGDGKHEFRRDAPPGRGHWHSTRRDADALLAVAVNRWKSWEAHRPEPHMVAQVVATTSTEKVA